jgi:aminopeptidase-like protein
MDDVAAGAAGLEGAGAAMHRLAEGLYPICRSITGNGVRETLAHVRDLVPLTIHEVPSGTPVLDLTVPPEWNVTDAFVKNASGERIVDFRRSNLHVLNCSEPFSGRLSLAELKEHLHSLPDHPDWVPYRTSYYVRNWGFCLSHRQLLGLEEGEYDVCVASSLEPGSLTYGEYAIPGRTDDEVHRVLDFYPYGYDERQYSSPGFDLAVGAFMRSQHGTFPEYHTSADDLGFVRPQRLAESLQLCLSALDVLEHDRRYVNLSPKGEPQLGRRGIHKAISGQQGIGVDQTALLWVLNLSDGEHSLLDIAERAGVRFEAIRRAAELLREHELLREVA